MDHRDQYDHDADDLGTEYYSQRFDFKETYDEDGFLVDVEAVELELPDLADEIADLFSKTDDDHENRDGWDGENDTRTEISFDTEHTEVAPEDLWWEQRDDEYNHAGSSLDPTGMGMYHTDSVRAARNRASRIRNKRLDPGGSRIRSIQRRGYRNTAIAKHNQTVSRIASELRQKGKPLPKTIKGWDKLLAERAHNAAEKRLSADLRRYIEDTLQCNERTAYRVLKEIKNAEGDWAEAEVYGQFIESYRLWCDERAERGCESQSDDRAPVDRLLGLKNQCLYHALVRGHFFFAHQLKQVNQQLPEFAPNRPVAWRHY